MKRIFVLIPMIAGLTGLMGLAGCGEKPQSMGGVKSDVAAFEGAQNPFVVPGWKAGDKTSWEQQLKTRTQNTQNEYMKIN